MSCGAVDREINHFRFIVRGRLSEDGVWPAGMSTAFESFDHVVKELRDRTLETVAPQAAAERDRARGENLAAPGGREIDHVGANEIVGRLAGYGAARRQQFFEHQGHG